MTARQTLNALVVFSLVLCISACSEQTTPPKNVILVTLDTVRADHLGCYGYDKGTTPGMDRLAATGVVFENAFTPVPITLPSHTTILTGSHPLQHGIHNNGTFVLEDAAQTLAEDLKARGFRTGAVMGGIVLGSEFGLDQGFDFYEDRISRDPKENNLYTERPADEVTRLGIEWIEKVREGSFFLWLHYFDPHADYKPPSPFKENFPESPYDGEIAFVDHCFNQVIEKITTLGKLNETLIIIVGDHGEGLGDHGELLHAVFLYDSTVRVPLIFHYPGLGCNSMRIDCLVDTLDIRPTVLELLDGRAPAKSGAYRGGSLLPLTRNEPVDDRPVLLETNYPAFNYGWSPLAGFRTREWKYIHAPKPELYRIDRDTAELQDLSTQEPEHLKIMEARYWKLRESLEQGVGAGLARKQALGREMEEKLKRLGYVWSKESRKGQEGKDPKDMIRLIARLNEGRTAIQSKDPSQGVGILEEVLRDDPENFQALFTLGSYFLFVKQDPRQAKPYLERAVEANPHHTLIHFRLGVLYGMIRDRTRAIRSFEEAHALTPNAPEAAYELGRLYGNERSFDLAEEWYRKALDAKPSHMPSRIDLATLYALQYRLEDAEKELRIGLQYDAENTDALITLGKVCHVQGRTREAIKYGEEAQKIDPANRTIRQYLAEWYEALGIKKEDRQ
ncbi:MAG: sulfatase-like hydrolase/transferase [Planctomycetes bacterium]|nr:sulfatase-like hydrolase/transferase [Planctomycetota bacterium]